MFASKAKRKLVIQKEDNVIGGPAGWQLAAGTGGRLLGARAGVFDNLQTAGEDPVIEHY